MKILEIMLVTLARDAMRKLKNGAAYTAVFKYENLSTGEVRRRLTGREKKKFDKKKPQSYINVTHKRPRECRRKFPSTHNLK